VERSARVIPGTIPVLPVRRLITSPILRAKTVINCSSDAGSMFINTLENVSYIKFGHQVWRLGGLS
jgi:hypothetical protein